MASLYQYVPFVFLLFEHRFLLFLEFQTDLDPDLYVAFPCKNTQKLNQQKNVGQN